jgi:hypothetical protein
VGRFRRPPWSRRKSGRGYVERGDGVGTCGSDGNRDCDAAGSTAPNRRRRRRAVTADLEGGYDLAPSDLVDAMLEAGAVGCNIDTDHATGAGP